MANGPNELAPVESRLESARAELNRRIRDGRSDGVDHIFSQYPEFRANDDAALELIYTEYVARSQNGHVPDRDEWYRRYPHFRDRLERLFGLYDLMADGGTMNGQPSDTVHDDAADGPQSEVDHPPGYTLMEEIGRGGMAVVYRARQESVNRVAAIKILRGSFGHGQNELGRLRREAELAARLQHPNIVQVIEVGDWKGTPFLAMEFVHGVSLNKLLAEHQKRGSVGVSTEDAAALTETLARAMHYAHEQGVVHRDLKPANVLLVGNRECNHDGQSAGEQTTDPRNLVLKIVDFGLAVVSDSSESVSQSLALAGTPCYMAPEQADARNSEVGPRTDVYALGGILYELLTGRPPFQGTTVIETLDMVRTTEPVAPRQIRPQIPRDLETICLKCLHKEPNRRFATAMDLAEDLNRFRSSQPIHARAVSLAERGWKWVRRYPAIAGLSLALLVAMTTALVAQTARYRHAEQARMNEQRLNRELQETFAQKLVASAQALWNGAQLPAMREALDQCPEQFRGDDWQALNRLCAAHLACWAGPEFAMNRMAVSRDGTRLAVRRRNGKTPSVDVLDAATGNECGSVASGFPLQAEFSADGKQLAVIQVVTEGPNPRVSAQDVILDNLVREAVIWDLATNAKVRQWRLPGKGGTMSRWASRIASFESGTIHIWDGTGEVVAELHQPTEKRNLMVHLAIDDDDRRLAIRQGSEELHIWDIAEKRLIKSIQAGPSILSSRLEFHRDGRLVYGYCGERFDKPTEAANRPQIFAWDVDDGREVFQIPNRPPLVMTSSPDGRFLANVIDQTIELHDARTGVLLVTLRGHLDKVLSIAFSADGTRLISSAADNTLRTWDVSSWRE